MNFVASYYCSNTVFLKRIVSFFLYLYTTCTHRNTTHRRHRIQQKLPETVPARTLGTSSQAASPESPWPERQQGSHGLLEHRNQIINTKEKIELPGIHGTRGIIKLQRWGEVAPVSMAQATAQIIFNSFKSRQNKKKTTTWKEHFSKSLRLNLFICSTHYNILWRKFHPKCCFFFFLLASTDWQRSKHGPMTSALHPLSSKVNWVQRRKTKCQRETGWSLSACVWTLRRSFIQYVGAFRKQRAPALWAFPIFFLTRRVWTHSCQMLLGRGHLFNTLGSWLWPCCGQHRWGYQPCAHC